MRFINWAGKLAKLIGKSEMELPQAGPHDHSVIADALNKHGEKGMLAALARLDMDEVQPLINELLACCSHVSGPNSLTELNPDLVDGIISDPRTLMALLRESALLNLGFCLPGRDMAELRANLSASPVGEVLHFNLAGERVNTNSPKL